MEPRKGFESEEPRRSSCAEGHEDATEESDEVAPFFPGSESSARSHTPSARKPGDLESGPAPMVGDGQRGEGPESHDPEKYAHEESDEPIVPGKPANSRVTPEE